jgi:hypothetical protein
MTKPNTSNPCSHVNYSNEHFRCKWKEKKNSQEFGFDTNYEQIISSQELIILLGMSKFLKDPCNTHGYAAEKGN